MRCTGDFSEGSAEPARFLMGEYDVGAALGEFPDGPDEEAYIERKLDERRPDLDLPEAEKVGDPADREIFKFDIFAERIRHQVRSVPEVGEGLDPEIDADRSATGLEKRLGGQHEDFHGGLVQFFSSESESITSRTA
jgi:hypothetical protein